MTPYKNIQNFYFLGIGGIGMSALAQFFAINHKNVAGYDKTPGVMTEKLIKKGISISFTDNLSDVPEDFKNKDNTLIVFTPAIPEDLKLFNHFKNQNFKIKKRSEVLGAITKEMTTLAIAGTHGKTTTTSILAHLLKQSDYKITAFLGGVSQNYHSNFIADGHDACVVEADEYDRSFLKLSPHYAAITSMDADHLDIYEKPEELMKSFHQFAEKVPTSDHLFYKKGLDLKGHSIAINEAADYIIKNIKIKDGIYHFDFETSKDTIQNISFSLPGKHNLMNAGMALSMALSFGANPKKLKAALKTFKGVERRFTYHLKTEKITLIEDYAHHPEEIKAVYQAARELYPNKKIIAVFQPHLYSRTRDFAEEFAKSLTQFDEIILIPIYPAREKPIPGIDSAYLLSLIENQHKILIDKNDILKTISTKENAVVLLLGAGDIGLEANPLKQALSYEN